MPPGTFKTVKGMIPRTDGLLREPGLSNYASDKSVDYGPIRDVIALWDTSGTQVPLIIDTKFVYRAETTGFTGQYYKFETAAGMTVTGGDLDYVVATGVDFAGNDVLTGDVLVTMSGGTYLESATIAGITDNSILNLSGSLLDSYASESFEVRRAFAGTERLLDNTVIDNSVIFVDGQRGPWEYDGNNLKAYCESGVNPVADTIVYFKDRAWVGRTVESGRDYRQRVRWTSVTDHDYFDTSYALDLPYTTGKIVKLESLEELLVAYFEDSIWIGRPTNVAGSALPYSFSRYYTAKTGLVGVKALCPYVDGHFFVGQDDIYLLTNDLGLQKIGTPIIKEAITNNSYLWATWTVPDPKRDRILFGIPTDDASFSKVWSYNYKSKQWSYVGFSGHCLAYENMFSVYTWDSIATGTSWDTGLAGFYSWDDIVGESTGHSLWVGQSGYLKRVEDASNVYDSGVPIDIELETGDIDGGVPETDKVFSRLSLRIDRELSSNLSFAIRGSADGGTAWKNLGTLTIPAGDVESHINFKLSGAEVRFELTSQSNVNQYVLYAIALLVKEKGLQTRSV